MTMWNCCWMSQSATYLLKSKYASQLDIIDNKKDYNLVVHRLWSRKTRAMKLHDNHAVAERRRFRKVPFLQCSSFTLMRLAGVFKSFHSGDRFRKVPFSMENLSGFVQIENCQIYPAYYGRGLTRQNNNLIRASHFYVHFFTVNTRLGRGIT